MAFSFGIAHAPNLEGMFNLGLPHRVVDRDQASYPTLHARNSSTKPDSVNMFVDSFSDDLEYAASIVSACEDRTVFALQCTSAPASIGFGSNCGPNGVILTVTSGANTYEGGSTMTTRTLGYDVTASVEETCTLAGTTAATCSGTAGGEADGTKTSWTTVATISSPTYYRFDVEITGGAEKTKNPSATCGVKGAATSLNAKTMALWALTGTFGVASLLTML